MRPRLPRIPPISPDEYTEEQAALIGDRGSLNFSRIIVQHPAMWRAFIPFAEKLMLRSDLPARDREILIIRTLALCHEAYEAPHHVLIARNVGMTDAEIEAARTGGPGLSPFDRALVRAAEELVRDHCVSDETWQILAQRYSRVQLMELVFLVGNYSMMSMVTSSFGMQVEDDPENTWKPNC